MKWPLPILVLILLSINSCTNSSGNNVSAPAPEYYTQGSNNRMAAEWEPAEGVMITWPLCIPYKLAIELAHDTHLYTLVDNQQTQKDAISWYLRWGIDTSKVTFIIIKQGIDAWWVRDWGPPAVFDSEKHMRMADGKYIYSTPVSGLSDDAKLDFIYKNRENKIILTEMDDRATVALGHALNTDVLRLPFISTGGNVMTDGMGSAFSTSILTNENRYDGVSNEQFFALNKELLGINNYHILSNFEKRGIQHIDCFMKLLDAETILVARPPANHPSFALYESIINKELKKLKTPYNRPYTILRIDTYPYLQSGYELSAYTNSLILNKTVYVPLFGIAGDSTAIKRWQEVMPGYKIKGFDFDFKKEPIVSEEMINHYPENGWNSGDALHCRTRAVWDKNMLYINSSKTSRLARAGTATRMFTTVIDYSDKGLQGNPTLYWRVKGEAKWQTIQFTSTTDKTHFFADIPALEPKQSAEYYIAASSISGRTETIPKTAPYSFYTIP